tara:strand:+ start:260 stop:592 length:333 start_codon:yes stop_codon:yes gene_type:complete
LKPYKDFFVKTFIVTIAVLIVLQVVLSPLKKSLRLGEQLLNKVEIYEKRIKDDEFLVVYHKVLLSNLRELIYFLADSEGVDTKERLKIQQSIIKILDRDIKPILKTFDTN